MSHAIDDAHDGSESELGRASREIAALSSRDYPTPNDQCDVIMKGGITSGVVYPLTICKLATRYRLRSIGGASAGAIAAVLAAAAEHRRLEGGDRADHGFRRLAGLPTEVAERLEGLFQPLPSTRRIFDVLFAAIDPKLSGAAKARAVVGTVIARKFAWFIAGLLLTVALALPGLIVAAGFPISSGDAWRILIGCALPILAGVAVGIVAAAIGLAIEANRVLPATGFGLTDGSTQRSEPALTEWLADEIDATAGLSDPTKCLTLGDLWGRRAVEQWSTSVAAGHQGNGPIWPIRAARRIELEVMTTNLTLHRPFRLPFAQHIFMFDESEMRHLFPDRVVDTMKVAQSDKLHPETGEPLWYFPGAGSPPDSNVDVKPGPDALPLIVMARMSLSFPGLIGAVPLYAVDNNGDQSVVRMWFSDGGLSSNFPMHFFDSFLPTRPTFGINLQPGHPSHPDDKVWRPHPTRGGTIPRAQPFETVAGFAGSLLDTMQNWSDQKQSTQRGYADRIVEIRLADDEGGMNLRMPKELILRLVARGAEAGDELLEFDWDAHRVIRYRVAMARLTDALGRLRDTWERDGGALYRQLIESYPTSGEAGSSYLRGVDWWKRDREATDALAAAMASWAAAGWPGVDAPFPNPSPIVTMVPR